MPHGLLEFKANSVNGVVRKFSDNYENRKKVEDAAMQAVIEVERELGNIPEDVSARKEGYDIISFNQKESKLRFIEVKGRTEGAETVTVSKNEIITGLNKGEDFALAIVSVEDGQAKVPRYVWAPFDRMPSENTRSINYDLNDFNKHSVGQLDGCSRKGRLQKEINRSRDAAGGD